MFQTMAVPKIVLVIDADESVCRRRKLSGRKSGQVKADCWQRMMFETEVSNFAFYATHMRLQLYTKF
uniref:Uncharacterized protein n=1 Tax=Anopheles quadriannulatus TaxID=34691 RepID=A0A182XSQ4_ANOQN